MADKPQAKNELGQLFVDIGINGLGKTLKGLNSVAATFLLGKNAANQFIKSVAQPFKEAGNAAVNIGKMSNALATTSKEFQDFAMYLKKYNLSENLLGDVSKLQKETYNWADGTLNITNEVGRAFNDLKLDFNDYRGSFKDTLKLLDDIQERTSNMSKAKRNQILDLLELNSDWGYLWDKGGRAGDYLTISNEAIERNQSLAEAMASLASTFENFTQNVLSYLAPDIEKLIKTIEDWIKHFNIPKAVNDTKNAIDKGGNAIQWFFTPFNQQEEKGVVAPWKYGGATGGAANVGYMGELPNISGADISPNLSGLTQNISISHDITINGNNADDIANQIASISAQDIQYTQYQAANLPGI